MAIIMVCRFLRTKLDGDDQSWLAGLILGMHITKPSRTHLGFTVLLMSFAHILAVEYHALLWLRLAQTRKRVYPLPLRPDLVPYHSWVTHFNWTPNDLGSHILRGERHMVGTRIQVLGLNSYFIIGNLIYSNVLGIDMIIINSETVARELLGKRSAIYSDRPVIRTNEL